MKKILYKEVLDDIIKRDNATILGTYDKITNLININFKCQCGEEGIKNCLQLIKVSGAFCTKCTRLKSTQKQKETNLKKYGVECTIHAPLIKECIIKNNVDKYGVENIFSSLEIQKQIKNTMMERYGVEHISQTDECKQKTKNTCLERYGVDYVSSTSEFRDKVKQTFIKNYGVDNPNKTKEIRDKIKRTNVERYGVEYPSQCKEISEKTQKNSKRYKEYKMPSGDIRKVQGYEPFALDILLKKYKEDDIKTDRKDIPRITYIVNEINKFYFPDIYIPSENKIIEVKSSWTYKCKLDNIQEKANATKKGFNYEIWIFDAKGNRTII